MHLKDLSDNQLNNLLDQAVSELRQRPEWTVPARRPEREEIIKAYMAVVANRPSL